MLPPIFRPSFSQIAHGFVTGISILAIGVQPILAQVAVDPAATGGLNVQDAPNGVPLVNIATPNGQGLSHNLYDEFNVGTEGLILNNEAGTFGQTQLGGVTPGNANLAGSGAARVILNEVVSGNGSALNGVTEVAGQSADVIVANPNGITCNGCGFIRTPRVVLTTGTPDIVGGSLQGFTVDGGEIMFGVDGADLSGVSLFDIISRQVTFEGSVAGQDVRVATGRNSFAYATGAVTALADDGGTGPAFAIDSTAVGGLYAGRISLLSTEAGVAVRAPREMSASAGGMTLTADGRLVIGRAQASGSATIRSNTGPVVVETSLFADDAIELTGSSAEISAGATIASAADLTVTADTVTLGSGALAAAGMDADGTLGAAADIAITTDALAATGAQIAASGDARLLADAITLNQTGGAEALTVLGNVDVETAALSATGATLSIGDDLAIASAGGLTITGGDYDVGGGIDIAAETLSSSAGFEVGGNADLSTQSGDLDVSGDVATEGALALASAGDLNIGGDLRAGTSGLLSASGTLTNDGAVVTGGALSVEAANVVNRGPMGSSGANLAIITLGDISNTGLLYSGGGMVLALDGTLENDFADIISEGGLTIQGTSGPRAAALLNRSANIEAITGSILIAAALVENSQPTPTIVPQVTVETRSGPPGDFPGISHPSRTYDVVQTITTTRMIADPGTNAPARIVAGGDLTINAGTITNDYSAMAANGDVTLTAGSIINTGQDLVETVVISTESFYRERYCDIRILGICFDYDYRNRTRTTTDRETATSGAVFATIQAAGTLSADVDGYLGNNAVRAGASQVGLTSGDRALATPPQIGAVNPNVILGRSGLFQPSGDPNTPFLIETRPEFVDVSEFLSSDYFLDQIGGYDPDLTQRRFGDAYVEARLIQEQLFALTGRQTATNPDDLRALMQGLYDNAVDATGALQLTPGVALSAEQVAALTETIVWLEEQIIDGQAVLVPVVYLGAEGLDEISLASGQIAANRVDVDAGTVANTGLIAGVEGLEIETEGDLLNIGGQITSDGDIDLDAEGRFANVSGEITGADISIAAAEFENSTAVIRDETEFGFSDRPQATGLIAATGNLGIDIEGDLTSEGGQFSAGGDATLQAGGDIAVSALRLETLLQQAFGDGYDHSYSLDVQLAEVTASGSVTLGAGNDLTLAGAAIVAGGDASLAAVGDIEISSVQEIRQDDLVFDIDSGGLFGVETDIRRQDQVLSTEQTTIDAAGTLTIASGEGDVILEAPALTSGDETVVSAENGQVSILTTEDSAFTRDERREEDLLWWNSEDEGSTETTRTFTQIEAGGGLQIISGGEIVVEYTATGNFGDGIAQLAAAPGLEWMAQLEAMDNVAWQRAETAFEEWDYQDQGLTEAGALLVTVVTTFALGPGIDALALNLTGQLGGSAALNAAINAGLTTLTNQAAVSLINNQGDIGAVLEELGSADSLRGLVTAMVSAGLGSQLVSATGLDVDLPDGASLVDRTLHTLQADLIRASVNATVDVAINGGDLGDAFVDGWTNAMVMAGLGAVQERIGDFAAVNDIPEGSLSHALAHAVAGGLAAELAGESFEDGALGAALAAITGPLVGGSDLTPERQVELQNLIATTAALLAGAGVDGASIAGSIGGSAHENNYLNHNEWEVYLAALEECGDNAACTEEAHQWAEVTSLENQHRMMTCRAAGTCSEIIAELDGAEALRRQFGNGSDLVVGLQNAAYYNSRGNRIYGYAHRDTGLTGEDLEYNDFHATHCGTMSNADCVRSFETTVSIRQMGDRQTQLGALGTIGTVVALVSTGCGGVAGCFILLGGGAMSADQLETGLDNTTALFDAELTNSVQGLMELGFDQETAEQIEFWTGMGLGLADIAVIVAAAPRAGRAITELDPYDGPVQIGQARTYGDSTANAVVGDGLTGDHMPSRAAMQARLEDDLGRSLTADEATRLRNATGCVIVTGAGHCAMSNTFGGRNDPTRIQNDAANLRAAADIDFTAMIPDLRANGMTAAQIDAARQRLHILNGSIINDINVEFGTQIRY